MTIVSASLYDSAEATVLARRSKQMGFDAQTTLSIISGGQTQAALDQMGLELGINKNDGKQNLTFDSYVKSSESGNNMLFQGEDGLLTNLNFDEGTYSQESVEDFAEDHGLIEDDDKFYDVVDFGQNEANFIDYAFEGTGDGKADKTTVNVGDSTWQSIKWVRQEVDQTTWGSGATDQVSTASNKAFTTIFNRRNQWLSATQKAKLQECTSYNDYLEKLAEYAVKDMDETGKAVY